MPCCAFAAFILGQILIGFDAVKRLVFGRSTPAVINPATEWRLGTPAVAAPRSRISPKWFAVAAPIEIALVLGAGYGLHLHKNHAHEASALSAVVCRSPRAAEIR